MGKDLDEVLEIVIEDFSHRSFTIDEFREHYRQYIAGRAFYSIKTRELKKLIKRGSIVRVGKQRFAVNHNHKSVIQINF
ncbi:MAG: hypothetical protein WCO84_00430 [bacterium]